MKLFFATIPAAQILLSTVTYYALTMGFGMKDQFTTKFDFIHEQQLGYAFLAVWVISLARSRLAVNANAQRAGARLDRPDQHIYKIMDRSATSDAPYVLMANTGAAGKFNRGARGAIFTPCFCAELSDAVLSLPMCIAAQRGAFNTDESMPMFLTNTLLAGAETRFLRHFLV